MRTKLLYRKKLSKEDRTSIDVWQNYEFYLLPTIKFKGGYKQFLQDVDVIWLFWEIKLFLDYAPDDSNECCNKSLEHKQ